MKVSIGKYPKKGERKVKVEIDNFDLWSLDHTLALIIAPALAAMKDSPGGSPQVANEDVPEELRDPEPLVGDCGETGPHYHERWAYVLGEMHWAFAKIAEGDLCDTCGDERVGNGLRLFGKYYRSLWN